MRDRVAWYVGAPQSGKTTTAVFHALRLAGETRRPVLVLDALAGARQLQGFPPVRTLRELTQTLWGERRSCRYLPRSMAEVDAIAHVALAGKDLVVLVDEAHSWINAHSRGSQLFVLMRATQHARTSLLLTTHHFGGDVAQVAQACAPRFHLFNQTSPSSLEALRRGFGADPGRLAALRVGQFITIDTELQP